jgi:hypothetical protein
MRLRLFVLLGLLALALSAVAHAAKPKPKPNPAFARTACAKLVPLLQPLAPGVTILGSRTNTLAPKGIDCWFQANGQAKAFNIDVIKGADAKPNFAATLKQYKGYAADATITCSDGSAQASLQTINSSFFAWESCPPPQTGYILAGGYSGTTYAYVYANPYRVAPSLAQVEGVVHTLLAKFRKP